MSARVRYKDEIKDLQKAIGPNALTRTDGTFAVKAMPQISIAKLERSSSLGTPAQSRRSESLRAFRSCRQIIVSVTR